MLIGIDPVLNADVIYALASMGHGDELVLCDTNFPAMSVASTTTWKKPVQLSGDVLPALKAILTVLPVDTFDIDERPPICGMQVVGEPKTVPETVATVQRLVLEGESSVKLIERHAFYKLAAQAFVIIRTNEIRPYSNFIIRKGVV